MLLIFPRSRPLYCAELYIILYISRQFRIKICRLHSIPLIVIWPARSLQAKRLCAKCKSERFILSWIWLGPGSAVQATLAMFSEVRCEDSACLERFLTRLSQRQEVNTETMMLARKDKSVCGHDTVEHGNCVECIIAPKPQTKGCVRQALLRNALGKTRESPTAEKKPHCKS